MSDLPIHKGPTVSLVQDQDILLADDTDADLVITIISAAQEDGSKHVTDILVSSKICNKSPYLSALLDESHDKTEITLGGDAKSSEDGEDKEGVLVWLAHLHDLTQERMKELGLWHISLLGVWYAISLWDLHQDSKVKEKLGAWFDNWYDTNMVGVDLTISTARALAYPCYILDHAVGYARITKFLAYNHIGHIKERPPKGFKGGRHHHIGERQFLGPINHARGGLRNTLHKSLCSKVGRLLRFETDACTCWDATVGRYQYALTKVDAWPIDDVLAHSSISQVVCRLKDFQYKYIPKCKRCRGIDWETIVLKAQSNTDGYFNGMCLDCMGRSKPKGEDLDDEYEKQNESVGGRWDTRCRIKHGQPTWYISWLGRPDIREKILRGPEGYHPREED